MTIFDVAERGVCTVNRRETSTPLQALVLLNGPQYIEAARVLAEHLLENYEDVNSQLSHGYKVAVGRAPDEGETEILKHFYLEEFAKFSEQEEDALAYITTGSSTPSFDFEVPKIAALTTVLNGIMNTADGFTIR
jgi:hypothetical protein